MTRLSRIHSFFLILVSVVFGVRSLAGDVVINEIMYHPVSNDEDEEYIELYNTGPATADISGWRFDGAVTFVFPSGTTIAPDDYLVVAKSLAAFQALYTTSTAHVIGDYAGRLNNAGEELRLYDAASSLVDRVAYDDEGYWPKDADGDGPSLELINPRLDNSVPQSWAASSPAETPGLRNSQYAADPPPFLVRPRHDPAVPHTTDTIAVTVYAYDDSAITSVGLFWREDPSTGPFTETPMLDDGTHGDGAAGDGVYGALLPPQSQGTILEFWMRAVDDTAQITDIPTTAPTQNFLLQVDDEDFSATSPTYRLVMKEADHRWLHQRDYNSNELVNATFIYGDEIYYNVGVRFRGKGSRKPNRVRKSYRVQFTSQQPFHGIENLNLNAQWIRCQAVDMDLLRRAGIPAPATKFVYLVFKYRDKNTYYLYDGDPGSEPDLLTMGWRIQMQDLNKKFLREWFPGHSGGNLYRGYYCSPSRQADLTYYGTDKEEYRCPYEKKTNKKEDDFSDVIELCDIFTNTPAASFTQTVQQYIDVREWMRFWGCLAMINIEETDIYNTRGDDYFMYFDPATSPPRPKAVLLPWDLDEANLNPTETIFACTLPRVKRFCENPDFTPWYFWNIQDLLDNYYTLDIMLPKIDALAPYHGFEGPPAAGLNRDTLTLNELKNYVRARIAYLQSVISRSLTVNVSGATKAGDIYLAFNPTVTLNGRGLTAWTRWVTVNGNDAGYHHLTGDWGDYTVNLNPGLNTVTVECLTTAGVAVTTETLEIRYVTTSTNVCGTLSGNTLWTSASSPYVVTCDVVVPDGSTLALEPGTIVLLDPGCSIFVQGSLLAEGTEAEPIIFAPHDSASTSQQTLIAAGSTWKYTTGTDLGTAWREPTYDDSSWSSGPAQLGYGDGDEATVIPYGPNPSNKYPCYYFRHSFNLADPGAVEALTLSVIRDDGCVVYLNGTEVARSNMPLGTITYNTWASGTTGGGDENTWYEFTVSPSLLVAGTNVVAVEVHQVSGTSSDLSFDLRLAETEESRWGVIALEDADTTARLAHCYIGGGSTDTHGSLAYGAMVAVVNSSADIRDCRFADYAHAAIGATSGSGTLAVSRCFFDRGGGDCIRSEGYSLDIEGSTFTRRTLTGASALFLAGPTAQDSLIKGNWFLGSDGGEIVIENAGATVESNVFHDAAEAALAVGSGGQAQVGHNVIYDCNQGIVVRNGASALIDHNTLYGLGTGVHCLHDPASPGSGDGSADLSNTIIWNCTTPILVESGSTLSARYSDIQGTWPGTGNFDLDPLFVNEAARDLHIRSASPCRNGGEGGTYVGAFPAAMGSSEVRRWERY